MFFLFVLFCLVNDGVDELVKCGLTFVRVFEDCGGVKDCLASSVDIVGDGFACFLFADACAVVHDELGYHAEMLVERMIFFCNSLEIKRSLACQDVAHEVGFRFESAGQDEESHDLDYTDRFLLDIVEFNCGVEDAKRMFLVSPVVAKNEIELIFAVFVY